MPASMADCDKRSPNFMTHPLGRTAGSSAIFPGVGHAISQGEKLKAKPQPTHLLTYALPATSPINPHSGAELRIICALSPVLHRDATIIRGATVTLSFSLPLCKLLHL